MARQHIQLSVDIAGADLDAYVLDMRQIIERYGFEDDCPPHNRKARDAELERAGKAFYACIDVKVCNG